MLEMFIIFFSHKIETPSVPLKINPPDTEKWMPDKNVLVSKLVCIMAT